MNRSERDEICFLPATELATRYAAGELSPVDVTEAVLDRMGEIDPRLGAFCTPTPGSARAQARRAADALARSAVYADRVPRMARLMADHDLLVTPTATVPPFPVGILGPELVDGRAVADTAWIGAHYPAGLTGRPAVSLPAGFTDDGLPVGVQVVGRHPAEASVLRVAAAYEQAAPWAGRRPRI